MALDFSTIPRIYKQISIDLELVDSIDAIVACIDGGSRSSWIAESCWQRAHLGGEDTGNATHPYTPESVESDKTERAPSRPLGSTARVTFYPSAPLVYAATKHAAQLRESFSLYVARACEIRLRQANLDDATLTRYKRDIYNAMYPRGHESTD